MSTNFHGGFLLAIITLVTLAITIGWFIDQRTPVATTSPLQVPDNIDYYLSNVNFRSMNQQGTLHYRLQSPYLEHFIREDISQIQQPDVLFKGDKSSWLIQANSGKLLHKSEVFELTHQVELQRTDEQEPLQVATELMILRPQINLVEMPQAMSLRTSQLDLLAASARLDIKKNQYQFNRVKATYQPQNSSRKSHEAG